MATVQVFSQFPCKTRVSSPSNSKSISKPPIMVPMSSIIRRPVFSTGRIAVSRADFRTRATDAGIAVSRADFRTRATDAGYESYDWGSEAGERGSAPPVEEEAIEPVEETEQLKRSLVDSLYGTDRGLNASSETRAEIGDLITQLESKNPTPAPTEALFLLNGKWILAYTSFVNLFPLLSRGIVPLVKVDEISQTIDSDDFTVQNSVRLAGPLGTESFSTNAKFEIRSPKRVQIKFEEGVIGTPQLTDSIEIPDYIEVLGQQIDLYPIRGLLTYLQDTASSVAKSISSHPPFKFSLPGDNAQSWLLTTYLDKDIRISRGDGGSAFVLIKEGSPLLNP